MYMQVYVHNKNYMWIGLKKFNGRKSNVWPEIIYIYYLLKSYLYIQAYVHNKITCELVSMN